MKVRNYELSNDGVLLYISHNGKQYYTEYTPEIESLLSSGILGSFSNNGKRGGYYPKFDLGPSKRRYTPYLHHIIYCVHHYGMTAQNHMDILQEFHSKLKSTKGCVDHLHDGLDNCCISNLHFMTLQDHYRKTSAEHSSRLRTIRKKAAFFHVLKANDGKPFVVLINSAHPESESARELCRNLTEEYGVTCVVHNCMVLTEDDISSLIGSLLFEFPIYDMGVDLPSWVDALPMEHPIKSGLFEALRESAADMYRISDVKLAEKALSECEIVSGVKRKRADLGAGHVRISVEIPRELFYKTLSESSGLAVEDDGDLMMLLTELAVMKTDYEHISEALNDVRTKGYGVVMPTNEELELQEPEIVKHGGRYGVRLKASAPSIHMIRANIETEVSPGVGGEKSSEDIISFLLQEFEGNTGKLWESNIFGKSLYEIAGEGLAAKIKRMPEESQMKLRDTLERIINEGSNGLICIIL